MQHQTFQGKRLATHSHTFVHTSTHLHTCTHKSACTYRHACMHAWCMHAPSLKRTHPPPHAHAHTHALTHTHTQKQRKNWLSWTRMLPVFQVDTVFASIQWRVTGVDSHPNDVVILTFCCLRSWWRASRWPTRRVSSWRRFRVTTRRAWSSCLKGHGNWPPTRRSWLACSSRTSPWGMRYGRCLEWGGGGGGV